MRLLPSNPRGKQDHVLAQTEASWVKRCWTASSPTKLPQKRKIKKLDLAGMINQSKRFMSFNKITKTWKYVIYLCIGVDLLVWKILKALVVLVFPYCKVLSVNCYSCCLRKQWLCHLGTLLAELALPMHTASPTVPSCLCEERASLFLCIRCLINSPEGQLLHPSFWSRWKEGNALHCKLMLTWRTGQMMAHRNGQIGCDR